jgi:hypothetical protein
MKPLLTQQQIDRIKAILERRDNSLKEVKEEIKEAEVIK